MEKKVVELNKVEKKIIDLKILQSLLEYLSDSIDHLDFDIVRLADINEQECGEYRQKDFLKYTYEKVSLQKIVELIEKLI